MGDGRVAFESSNGADDRSLTARERERDFHIVKVFDGIGRARRWPLS